MNKKDIVYVVLYIQRSLFKCTNSKRYHIHRPSKLRVIGRNGTGAVDITMPWQLIIAQTCLKFHLADLEDTVMWNLAVDKEITHDNRNLEGVAKTAKL